MVAHGEIMDGKQGFDGLLRGCKLQSFSCCTYLAGVGVGDGVGAVGAVAVVAVAVGAVVVVECRCCWCQPPLPSTTY